MPSVTTKPQSKNSKRRKIKSQPVTSGSKPGTPGPSTSADLNVPLDRTDPDENSHSGPDLAFTELTSRPASPPSSHAGYQRNKADTRAVCELVEVLRNAVVEYQVRVNLEARRLVELFADAGQLAQQEAISAGRFV